MNASLEICRSQHRDAPRAYTVPSDGTTAERPEVRNKMQPTCHPVKTEVKNPLANGPSCRPPTTEQLLGVKHPTVSTTTDYIGAVQHL